MKIIVLIFLLKSPAEGKWSDEKSSFANINAWRPTGGKPLTKPVMAQFSETYAALTKCYLTLGHQAITCTNVDLSSVRSSDIHLRANSQEITQPSIAEIIWKIKYLKFRLNFPGANELIQLSSIYVSVRNWSDPAKYWPQSTLQTLRGVCVLCISTHRGLCRMVHITQTTFSTNKLHLLER